ncbi:MAG: DUF2157 domain-containing protein [Hyphomonadaceae bacterium]|nr:DUF2157 domain-containing protein [Hyphomonadaceae bacterium]
MSWYSHRVERDLARWQAAGWVSDTGATAIKSDLAARKSAISAAGIFAILGAILFGFAIMSFVAAHWTAMSKLSRLVLILAALWACYGAAGYLSVRKLDAFAQAAILGGIAVYGAGIMLIAQMYHMEGSPPDAVLTWALGALLAAGLAQSRPALAAGFVLIVVWTVWERMLIDAAHWGFLPVWVAAVALAVWLGWRPGLHLAALSLLIWLTPLGFFVLGRHAHWLVALIGAGTALAAAVAGPAIDRHLPAAHALFAYGIAAAFWALFTAQFIDDYSFFDHQRARSVGRLLLLAVLTLAGLLAAMYWALQSGNRGALWIGYAAFAAEIFALYWRTLGTLLDTSLFFLVAAILVSVLAWVAYLLHQRKLLQGSA